MKVSDSTSDLVDNMEETAAETPVYPRQVKSNLNNLHNQIFFNNVCVFEKLVGTCGICVVGSRSYHHGQSLNLQS